MFLDFFFFLIDREMQYSCACVRSCVLCVYVDVCVRVRVLAFTCMRMYELNFSSSLSRLLPSSSPFPHFFFFCVRVCCFSSHYSHQLGRQLYTAHLFFTPRLVLITAIRALAASNWWFFLRVLRFSHSFPEMFGTGFLLFLFQGRT